MIDLHCHLLPGIDDGAKDMAQSLRLARAAVANGITHCVVTPHIHPGRFPNSLATISPVFAAFKEALKAEAIPLRLGMAAEVRISDEIPVMLAQKQLPFLGDWEGRKVLLLEMPDGHIPPGAEQLIRWLLKNNIQPMIAHPERNKDVMRDVNKILPLARLGCLFQVTASAVAGYFGKVVQQCTGKLLTQNLVTILATDAHHEKYRPPVLEAGRRAAEGLVGESKSWELVRQNPGRIAARHFINTDEAS